MSLTSGNKLGPYEIVGPLGAGGMGEVLRRADGQRFVVVYEGNRPSSTLTSVVNWTADLKEH